MGRKVLLSSFLRVFAKFAQPKHARLGRGEDTRPFSSLRVCVQLAAGAVGDCTPKCSLHNNIWLSVLTALRLRLTPVKPADRTVRPR